ncbi:putative uncharacterized protein FLJ37770 [Mycetomoellerius zeteki]|uniref:putative uncharacterized protein FLJ37770 n=1 Tax=Mycetomoellerius zeteki TaxID=64791 RepID=UPI00084E3D76|nr:PREDICTED: putative uncharacterized protein FLJ37770 [Trachymyrmex zeteki]
MFELCSIYEGRLKSFEPHHEDGVTRQSHFGNTSTQIKAELDAVYGDSVPSFATVKKWVAEFKRGRTNLADDERSGWPTTAITTDNIEEIHQMIMDNRRIKVREIAEAVGISKERVCHIHID